MTPRARTMALALLLVGSTTGCGQQGPLVLPDDARPVERIDPAVNETEQRDDEGQDER